MESKMKDFTEKEAKAYDKSLGKMYKPTSVNLDDLLGRDEPPSKDKSLKIINKVRHKINRQKEQWGDEKHLSPHQWLGLIAEEIGEMTEAVNETYLPNRTKEHLGGIEHIQEEAIQAMALMVRFLESINEEQTND